MPTHSVSKGAIEPLGDGLLLVTAQGRLAQVSRFGNVTYLGGIDVPMNRGTLEIHEVMKNPRFQIDQFRIGDVLIKQKRDELEIYVSHHYFNRDCMEFRISSTILGVENDIITTSPVAWKTVFEADPCIKLGEKQALSFQGNHMGGRMLLDGEHHILVVIGDQGLNGFRQGGAKISLDPHSHHGKLVRIESRTGNAEILARGLRVPQGLVRDAKGNLWETEHGPQGGDELNLLLPGLNYGWPDATYGIQYGNKQWPHAEVQGRHSGSVSPVYAWIPSIGISSVIVSNSQQFPLWKDDLLIASLMSKSIFRARLSENRVVYVEPIFIGRGIQDMVETNDGSIALLLQNTDILFLNRSLEFCKNDYSRRHIYAIDCTPPRNDYYQSIMAEVGHHLILSSHWDIYIHENRLVYTKESCSQKDIDRSFFLHIVPVDKTVLPDHRKQSGFDNLDFYFEDGGLRERERCLIIRQLPDYGISLIRTGQNISEGTRWWEVEYIPDSKNLTRTGQIPTSLNGLSESPQVQSSGASRFSKNVLKLS